MRNRALHDALRDFALEAAALLTDELRDGAEIEFEVTGESPRGGPALYRYKPLTEAFISARWDQLRELPSCPEAARLLGAGASAYLRVHGMRGEQAEPALQALLERLYEDATSFGFPEERFERVYSEVELTLFEDTVAAIVAVPLNGLVLDPDRIDLGDGLALVRGDCLDAPRDAVWPHGTGSPRAFATLERAVAADDPLDADGAIDRIRGLVTGLRLFKPGSVSPAAVAWRRHGEGRWTPVEVDWGAPARGEPLAIGAGEEAELRDFLHAVATTQLPGTVHWAVSRFEMGCERAYDSEALSDYMLAMRTLLDANSDAGRASLAMRLAALCGEDGQRRATQRRIEMTLALERHVVGAEPASSDLVTELEDNLRAILRDVICGYLDADLPSVADDLLLETPEPMPPEIRVRDLRKEQPPPAAEETVEFDVRQLFDEGAPEGVTASDDWGFADEDPASYSAPV